MDSSHRSITHRLKQLQPDLRNRYLDISIYEIQCEIKSVYKYR